ncbi:MAG: quinol:cytochrome C oxidoreductase [Cyclobacteriaceae bacterium]
MITDEKFVFTSKAKRSLYITAAIGLILAIVGVFFAASATHHDEHAGGHEDTHTETLAGGENHEVGETHSGSEDLDAFSGSSDAEFAGEHHEEFHWSKRLYANLWINNVYFIGLAIIGFFFVALQYAAQAGWSAAIQRIPLSFANWLPIGGLLLLITFILGGHDIFHWTHGDLYADAPAGDAIIKGKAPFFFWPLEGGTVPVFWIVRLVLYFVIWYGFYRMMKKTMLQEDLHGGTKYWFKLRSYSAIFLVLFAVTSSTSAWDWVMSIDVHWFSTMFGWYVFASWFVSGLAAITLVTVLLKEAGYLKMINSNHLHDLGKFVFAFSIFWTYIWFSQFLLIYYANIPEETIYFVERLASDHYAPVFFINLILNFFFPFLVLMTRDSKRHSIFLKIVCTVVLVGHWIDFYLMVTPGVLKENGGFQFLEVGLALIYFAAFAFVALLSLSKHPLVPKNHPMLEESIHHHI